MRYLAMFLAGVCCLGAFARVGVGDDDAPQPAPPVAKGPWDAGGQSVIVAKVLSVEAADDDGPIVLVQPWRASPASSI